ncbi:MAG: glycerate kinase [Verrucomicrobiota bacterium]|jgi:glycerate kinase|nr:glycerate kinase [Verrucomicrobiota bacterium]
MRVLVAPDSFKGTLTPVEAAEAIAEGVARTLPNADIRKLPLADGGEGTLEAIADSLPLERIPVPTVDARGRPVQALIGLLPGGIAVIETAQANGLALLPSHLRDPMLASTFGVGPLIIAARNSGARKLILTLGGSATVDGGFGMATCLGWQHLDDQGAPLPNTPSELVRLARILPPDPPRIIQDCTAWVDVQTPLLGPEGAVALFAPQKGASANDLPRLEASLARLAQRWEADLGIQLGQVPGGGAAGGLGAGCIAYMGAHLVSGAEALFQLIDLDRHLQWADCVITGEGCLDRSTFQGKLVAQLIRHAGAFKVPVLALAGKFEPGIEEDPRFTQGFTQAASVSQCCGAEAAMEQPREALSRTGAMLMQYARARSKRSMAKQDRGRGRRDA